jgi:CBS domain containing-hemolysin-like protein
VYNKKEITTMRQSVMGGHVENSMVHQEEVAIIGGALKFREMNVSEVMTPIVDSYMIPSTEKLSAKVGLFDI